MPELVIVPLGCLARISYFSSCPCAEIGDPEEGAQRCCAALVRLYQVRLCSPHVFPLVPYLLTLYKVLITSEQLEVFHVSVTYAVILKSVLHCIVFFRIL